MANHKLKPGRPLAYPPDVCAKVYELAGDGDQTARAIAERMPAEMPLSARQVLYILTNYTATGKKRRASK